MEKAREEKREQVRMGYRWAVDIPADYTLLSSNRVWEAKIVDLSLRGAKISSLSIPLSGKEVKLIINIPGGSGEICALGRIVWTSRTGEIPCGGIMFTKMRDADKDRILSYINSNFGDRLRSKVWWQDS